MDLVAGQDFIHPLAQGFLHVEADSARPASDLFQIRLHQERLRTTIEPLSLGKRREFRPKVELRLGIGLAIVSEKSRVVVRELAAPTPALIFLDVFAAVVDAEIADHDIWLPLKRGVMFRHPAEAALLFATHGIEIDAAPRVAEVAHLVFLRELPV